MFQDGNLFDLHFSFWRGRKGLKAEDVGLEEKNIPEIVILGQKMLIPEEEQRKFRAIESKIRSQVEALTFKFPIGVTARFVPFKVLARVIEIAKAGEIEFSTIVENFLADYDRIRAEMLEKYPDLRTALEPHYPDKSTLRSKYAFTWHIYQITTGQMGDAVACPEAVAEEYAKFQQKLQVEMDRFLEEVVIDLRGQVVATCQSLADKIGKGEIVRENTIQSVRSMVDKFQILNFVGDQKIEDALANLRKHMNGTKSADLKGDDQLRQELGRLAQEVAKTASDLSDVTTVAGRYKRKIHVADPAQVN